MIDCEFMHCMGDDDLVVDAARVSFHKQAGNYSDSRNDSVQPLIYVPFFNRVSGVGGFMFRAWCGRM